MKKWIVLSLALFSCSTLANVIVKFSPEVEILAINGVDDISRGFGHEDVITLENGRNQILVRVGTMIRRDAQKVKYKSQAMVMLFEAENTELQVSAGARITTGIDGDEFNKKPIFLLTENGKEYPAKKDLLIGGSLGFVRDYEAELYTYNKREAIASTFVYDKAEEIQRQSSDSSTPVSVSPEQAVIILKADFLRLSKEARENFLNWAEKQ